MHIVAFETTDQSGGVAALDSGKLLSAVALDSTLRSAATLAPALERLLQTVSWRPADVQLVAVATGPGSFTGLRVGVTTAKMFAYAVGAEVMGVDTLEAIAWQAPPDTSVLWTVMDALRNQVFSARFARDGQGSWRRSEEETCLLDDERWLAGLERGSAVSGPGLSRLASQLPKGVKVVAPNLWASTSATVGQLGWRQFQQGRRDDLWALVPQYFRRSAAEEKGVPLLRR